ncbi:Uncharacterised protein [Mycobacteroides abscessus subsp. abscessus]|nr:Uncharacterised protein [Mycobacteroides abscessus subsp. abscessus]
MTGGVVTGVFTTPPNVPCGELGVTVTVPVTVPARYPAGARVSTRV